MIIIPDIHGRNFWEKVVNEHENEEIIFLGDYHDPYSYEGITRAESIENFKKIIEFKKNHIDNVILLIGNHDAHYLSDSVLGSRFDYSNELELKQLFNENKDLFKMSYIKDFNGKSVIFSHAGIQLGWLKNNNNVFNEENIEEVVNITNKLFSEFNKHFFDSLGDVHFSRGGSYNYGSMVWADIGEHLENQDWIPNYYQVFGHSQQVSDPIVNEHIACLDCRKAFNIDNDGNITSIENE